MDDNGNELEGNGPMDEEQTEAVPEDLEDDAILKEADDASSPRDNI